MSQGTEANLSRAFLEDIVEREFLSRNVPVFRHSQKGSDDDLFIKRFLLKGVPYRSIYNCKATSEFVYRDQDRHNIRIECKWQQSEGSVDEKFPYLLENARRAMPESEIWLVVGGSGARPKALAWLRQEAGAIKHKTVRVAELGDIRKLIKNLPK